MKCRGCLNNKLGKCSIFKKSMAAISCSYFNVNPIIRINQFIIEHGRGYELRKN